MNGIPENINWKKLIGKTINQIHVGPFQTSIELGDILLSLECEFDFFDERNTQHGLSSIPYTSAPLLLLIGHNVIDIFKVNDSSLCFCIGIYKLIVHDSNRDFESFSLNGDDFSVFV